MADENRERTKEEIARAAEERRRDLEGPQEKETSNPDAGEFNPVEGVPPHGASIPGKR